MLHLDGVMLSEHLLSFSPDLSMIVVYLLFG